MAVTNFKTKTALFKKQSVQEGNIYRFYCDISGALGAETSAFKDDDPEKELLTAWKAEGEQHFNLCHKCGKWVIDAMYNPDVFNCVQCSPIEDIPNYCPGCGESVGAYAVFCQKCGIRLMYGEESDADD